MGIFVPIPLPAGHIARSMLSALFREVNGIREGGRFVGKGRDQRPVPWARADAQIGRVGIVRSAGSGYDCVEGSGRGAYRGRAEWVWVSRVAQLAGGGWPVKLQLHTACELSCVRQCGAVQFKAVRCSAAELFPWRRDETRDRQQSRATGQERSCVSPPRRVRESNASSGFAALPRVDAIRYRLFDEMIPVPGWVRMYVCWGQVGC